MGKQVKTPRFYVDIPTFLHATGDLHWDGNKGGAELLYMNCANPVTSTPTDQATENTLFLLGDETTAPKTSFPVNFCALLNHNLASDAHRFKLLGYNQFEDNHINLNNTTNFLNNVLNMPNANTIPTYNGTSIWTCGSDSNGINDYWSSFQIRYDVPLDTNTNTYIDIYTHQLGSMVVGKYFDCPNSPDLNLTMSRRFDGIKRQRTVGGKTLANIYYDGPTEWTMNGPNGTYKYPPFELDLATLASSTDDVNTTINEQTNDFNQISKSGIGRKGLRSWKLTFSYIAESDMWIDKEVSNTLISDGELTPENNDPNPMLSDNSFNFVWNCTLGGTLPFIFTDDKDSNEPDRYAICNFRENTFNVQQVAFNTYNVSMTIDEIA